MGYESDPRRPAFTLACYKHAAKMLEGFDSVLEVGCADGFGSRIVRQHVRSLIAIDPDARSIEKARRASSERWPIWFEVGSITDLNKVGMPRWRGYSAVYALDVLDERISPDDGFLRAMAGAADDVAIIGMPARWRDGPDLRARLRQFWRHAFLFTMSDESLGTSFAPTVQYLLALCVGPIEERVG